MDWLTAVCRDAPPSYFKIGFMLVQHINKHSGKGYPSEECLAELTRLSVPTVKRAVKFLKNGGWLTIERRNAYDPKAKAYKTHNVYSMDFQCVLNALDGITMLRRARRERRIASDRSVTGDTSANVLRTDQSITGDTLTPSKKKLREREKESAVPLLSVPPRKMPGDARHFGLFFHPAETAADGPGRDEQSQANIALEHARKVR